MILFFLSWTELFRWWSIFELKFCQSALISRLANLNAVDWKATYLILLKARVNHTYDMYYRSFLRMLKLTLVEVDPILDKLYINDTINRLMIPSSKNWRRVKVNERDFVFFLNSQFNFQSQVWKSGLLKIKENDWAKSDTVEYKFPILVMVRNYRFWSFINKKSMRLHVCTTN